MQYRGKIQSDYDLVNKKYVDNKASSVLPSVTSSDNGKVLEVVNGAWTKNSLEADDVWYQVVPGVYFEGYGGLQEGLNSVESVLDVVDNALDNLSANKQNKLVSGTNIKTINNTSLLGSGNISTKELPDVTTSDNGKILQVVSGKWSSATDNSIKSIKINGTALTPDSNKAVDIPISTIGTTSSGGTFGVVRLSLSDNGSLVWVTGVPESNGGIGALSVPRLIYENSKYHIDSKYLPSATTTTQGAVIVDSAMSGTSTNPVQNSVVKTYIDNAIAGGASFQGTVTKGTDISNLTNYKAGWYWIVQTAGTYVGQTCEVGDMIYCISNYNSAYSASDFSVVQKNVDMTLYWAKSELTAISAAEIDTLFA